MAFVKSETLGKIISCGWQDDNPHVNLSRSCFLAVSQSMKDSLPDLTRSSRSRNTSVGPQFESGFGQTRRSHGHFNRTGLMRQALHDGKRATMIQFTFAAGERADIILISVVHGEQSPR